MILLSRKRGLGAYCAADTAPKVGFRPYYSTDPHGAAMLSGLGQLHPLDPWVLYPDNPIERLSGLGQGGNPFKPEAWKLHGLGDLGQSSDLTEAAAEDLYLAGQISDQQYQDLVTGNLSFKDVVGVDPTDQSSWLDLVGLFREVNQDLQVLEHDVVSYAPQLSGSPAFSQLTADLTQKRQQYNDLASQLTYYYTAVIGSAPSGLSGLGFAPIVAWIAGAAVFLLAALTVLYGFRNWSKSIDVSKMQATTASQEAQIDSQLMDQLKKAQAAGDTVTANTILAALQQRGASPASSADFTQWFMNNAKWIGLGVAGLVVLPPLTDSLFGRRRR